MANPRVTIGIIGCNRLHYFRALMESAQRCIQYDNLEWIVFDNASIEDGMSEYLDTLTYVDHLIRRTERSPSTEHVTAMNEILDMATGEFLILMPDDMQFILEGNWLQDLVELAGDDSGVGSIVLNAQRHASIQRFFKSDRGLTRLFGSGHKHYKTISGREFLGYGDKKVGINPAGIGTFTRTNIFRELGPWKTTGAQLQTDSTGGGEDGMLISYWESGIDLDRILPKVPMSASIYAGPKNDQAYVRGNRRYARYMPPHDGDIYYRIWSDEEAKRFADIEPAASFEDVVEPIGFEHTMQDAENLLAWNKTDEDGFEWIHPSVEGKDIS